MCEDSEQSQWPAMVKPRFFTITASKKIENK